jgi:hypothetical protein
MKPNEVLQFVALIDERLERAHIPYMMTGSVALAFYSVPRMTRDVDIVIECDLKSLDVLVALFSTDCYIDRGEAEIALREHSMFNIIHNEWLIKADLIPRKEGDFRLSEFSRRRRVTLDDTTAWVVAPEDLILSKLDWSRDSRSEMQRRDIEALIRKVRGLDWAYMEKWATALGVRQALEQARQA